MAPRPPAAGPRGARLVAAAVALVLAVACGAGAPETAPGREARGTPGTEARATPGTASTPAPGAIASPVPAASPGVEVARTPGAATPSPAGEGARTVAEAVGANELGAVPVIMYHRVLPGGGGEYDLTPEEFRAELERLYEEGYRPIRTVDLVRGHIDVPAGTTPVVLTFDDGSREQFAYDDDGRVAADTAIGMLLEFAEEHPDFTPVASLYVNAWVFGGGSGSAGMLADLHARGFELGNHTHGHANLAGLEPGEIRRELAQGVAAIHEAVPEAEVVTLSLPFGVWPEDRALTVSGSWEGQGYAHEGILLVGSGPAPSPFHREFDPLAVPRVRTSPSWAGGEPDYGSAFWLDWLAAEPGRRYVSDGDPDTIAFPAALAGELDPRHAGRAVGY